MDPQIHKALRERSLKFTPELAEGLATSQLKMLERDIDKYFRYAFNEDDVVKYVNYRRCTPMEEFRVGSRQYSKNMFDLADSHVVMNAYYFEVNGVPMKNPRYMYVVYTPDRGGVLSLRGVKYHISPVVVDGGISIEQHTIFAWIEKDKLRLERLPHRFIGNGQVIPNYVMYSQLYRLSTSAKSRCLPANKRNKSESTAMHYLLCKFGLTETFKRFTGTDVVAGNLKEEDYPRDKFYFCEPCGMPPLKVKVKEYTPSPLRIAVPKDQWTPEVCILVTAFFYIADHFPNMVNEQMLENTQSWKVILGHTIFKSGESTAVLLDYIDSHFRSIESLLDPMVIKKLEFCDVYVNDFYDFLFQFSTTMATRLLEADPANVYNKKLTVNPYVGYPYMEAITTMVRMIRRINRSVITEKNVSDAMDASLRTEEILKLGTGNNFTEVLSNPGDCLLFKTTNLVVDQEHANAAKKPTLSPSNLKPAHRLHMSVCEPYAFGNLPKSLPTHRAVINHGLRINEDGSFIRDEKIRAYIDREQKNIERR